MMPPCLAAPARLKLVLDCSDDRLVHLTVSIDIRVEFGDVLGLPKVNLGLAAEAFSQSVDARRVEKRSTRSLNAEWNRSAYLGLRSSVGLLQRAKSRASPAEAPLTGGCGACALRINVPPWLPDSLLEASGRSFSGESRLFALLRSLGIALSLPGYTAAAHQILPHARLQNRLQAEPAQAGIGVPLGTRPKEGGGFQPHRRSLAPGAKGSSTLPQSLASCRPWPWPGRCRGRIVST